MDIYQQQSMQNWKKEIIMDQLLNSLFDNICSPEQFLNQKILTLTHDQIIRLYMKMTSLKHSISKTIQKEVELRHAIIQSSFYQNFDVKKNFDKNNTDQLKNNLKRIQKFNEKYEIVAQKIIEWKNANKIIHFAKALQKFRVNIRMLKTLMRDYDQNINNKFVGEIVNSQKISKILKDLTSLTLKFDFTGINSFQTERGFINNCKGIIYSLAEKELTLLLNKIGTNTNQSKRNQFEKQIINKLTVLSNINKLKDFAIIFYKNILKQVGEILKKGFSSNSFSIGDQKDPKALQSLFQEYFANTIHPKIIQNSHIFITFQQILTRNNTKIASVPNFFQKYWMQIVEYVHDLIQWTFDSESKQFAKQKIAQNLYVSFTNSDSKSSVNRYANSIIWKYPIIYNQIVSISNQIHVYIIKNTNVHYYDFSEFKQKLIKQLITLSKSYYKHLAIFFNFIHKSIESISLNIQHQTQITDEFILMMDKTLFGQSKDKKEMSLQIIYKILQWLLSNIKTQEIYTYITQQIIKITDKHYLIIKSIMGDGFTVKKQNLLILLNHFQLFVKKICSVIMKCQQNGDDFILEAFPKKQNKCLGLLLKSTNDLIWLIKKLKEYQVFSKQLRLKISQK